MTACALSSRHGRAPTTRFRSKSAGRSCRKNSPSARQGQTVLRILLDENIEGYADYLSGHLFSAAWNDISSALGVSLATFAEVGLAKGTSDEQIWQFCQDHELYLLTDNRNDDKPGSLESTI